MGKVNYLSGMVVTNQEIGRITDIIIENDIKQTPIVGEDVFVSQIIPLLQRPWNDHNLMVYKRYVTELTSPLRVAGVRNNETIVLFTVPPLSASVETSMATIHDITMSHVVDHISIIRARGTNEPVDKYIAEYMEQISQLVPVEKKVLLPLIAILAIYDKTLLDDDGTPLYSLENLGSGKPTSVTKGVDTSFESTGYLDED